MSKKPYRGMLKEDRKSIFAVAPNLSRWILRRPNTSSLLNLFGHAVNEDFDGVLFRDEDEARAAQRRQGKDKEWMLESFLQEDGAQLPPFTISQAELDTRDARGNRVIPLIEWPYLVMFRRSQALQFSSQELPVSPTRRELFHFISDKEAAAVDVGRDVGSLQTRMLEMQKMIEQLQAAQVTPGQVPFAPAAPAHVPPVVPVPVPVVIPAAAMASAPPVVPPVVPPSPAPAPIV